MNFIEENRKERLEFVDYWSEYVIKNSDRTWSKLQNKIINSNLKTAKMTKEEFLKMKREI